MTPAAQFLAAALNAPIERVIPWTTPIRWARAYADLSTIDRLSRSPRSDRPREQRPALGRRTVGTDGPTDAL